MPETAPTYDLSEIPGRGDLIRHEGRTYVIDETSLAIKDPMPRDTPWVELFSEGRNGAIYMQLHAVEVVEQPAGDEPNDGPPSIEETAKGLRAREARLR